MIFIIGLSLQISSLNIQIKVIMIKLYLQTVGLWGNQDLRIDIIHTTIGNTMTIITLQYCKTTHPWRQDYRDVPCRFTGLLSAISSYLKLCSKSMADPEQSLSATSVQMEIGHQVWQTGCLSILSHWEEQHCMCRELQSQCYLTKPVATIDFLVTSLSGSIENTTDIFWLKSVFFLFCI